MARSGRKRPAEPAAALQPKKPRPSPTDKPAQPAQHAQSPGEPSASLYIKNLNDHVAIADLRAALYMLFSSYGHVVALNAHKSPRMRGQAHVAFADGAAAAAALAALQGRRFLSKPLVLAYARRPSQRLVWRERDAGVSSSRAS